MHTKLTIPERLKDLRVSEKRMSLQELSDATGIPSSTLGNYEKDENIDMSLGNLITLANFYNVSTDYLLCRTELRKHKNQSVSDLHLNDDAIQILTDKKYNPRLLSELLTHENFKKFMTDLEIYIDGFNDKGIQIANAFLDVMRCKLTELGADSTDTFANVFDNAHIEAEQYYMNILSADLKPIVSDLRNIHMKDSNTASDIDYHSMVKNIIDDFATQIPTTVNDDTESSNDAYINGLLLLFCKNLEMKVTQLSVEEKQTLKEIFSCSKPAKEHRKLRRRNPFEQVQKADNATQAQMIMYSKMFKINFSKMDPYEFKTLTDILQRYSDAFKMPKGNGRGKKK